ncbi:MAG: hypothetical protein R3331_02055 [Sulfurospirillaceae bacterium]|nr:hypothetical protein [Sulfurospirillaceae bacterium]
MGITNFFSGLFSSGAAKVVDAIGNAADKLFTSDAERLQFRNDLQKELDDLKVKLNDALAAYDKEITTRWQSDNEHIITRLVRPLSFIYVLVIFSFMALLDGNIGTFHINTAYLPIFQGLLGTMVVAYFGSRGIEKVSNIIKKSNQGDNQ